MGRHSLEEVKQRLEVDLDACAALLAASGRYLTGASPCQADCFIFAIIDAVRSMPITQMPTPSGHPPHLPGRVSAA